MDGGLGFGFGRGLGYLGVGDEGASEGVREEGRKGGRYSWLKLVSWVGAMV